MAETTPSVLFFEIFSFFDKVREVRAERPHLPSAYRADVLKVLKDPAD